MHTGNRQQLIISQRFGGLGLYAPYLSTPVLLLSPPLSLNIMGRGDGYIHLQHAITNFIAQVSPHDTMGNYSHRFSTIPENLIQEIGHTHCWLLPHQRTILPPHHHMQVPGFLWLGRDTSGGSLCPYCPSVALDMLGHHAASCNQHGTLMCRTLYTRYPYV